VTGSFEFLSEGGGFSMSSPSLAVCAGHNVDVTCLNAFLADALQRVVREAVLVQAPTSASVVPSSTNLTRPALLPSILRFHTHTLTWLFYM